MGLKKATVKLGADIGEFTSKMRKATSSFKKMGKNIQKAGKTMSKSLTAPLVAIGAAALKGAADLEKLEASFVSLTGGTKEAADMMKQLTDFTAKTPFQIDAVANSARQLIASGTKVSDVNDQLQFLGDIAATSGSSIDDIAAIFSKVQSKGKVELESLNQLAERGIPIFKALSEKTGLLPSKLGAGAVSVEEFNEVLGSFNKEGGFAEGAMNRLSQTMAGKLSTALDNLKLAGSQLVQGLLPLIHRFLEGITNLAQKFMGLDEGMKIAILSFGLLLASIGPLVTLFGTLVSAVGFFMSPLGLVIAGLAALAAAAIYVADNLEAFKERFSDISWWKNALISMLQYFVDIAADIMGGYNKMLIFFKQTPVNNPFLAMSDGLEDLKDDTKDYKNEFGSFSDAISNGAIKAKDALIALGNSLGIGTGAESKSGGDAPVSLIDMDVEELEEEAEVIDTTYGDALRATKEKIDALKESAKSFGLAMVDNFAGSFATAITSGENFMVSMGNIFKDLAKQIAAMLIKAALLAAVFSMIPGLGAAQTEAGGATSFSGLLTGMMGGSFANGGKPPLGKVSLVGEQGPELFVPSSSGTIVPNHQLGGGSVIPDVRISGDDLLIVFDRANRRKARR